LIHLPIAHLSIDLSILLITGCMAGFLAGLLGVGGGFITTPLLIFLGIPSPVAVASQAAQLVGTSGISLWRHKSRADFQVGGFLCGGGLVGVSLGLWLFGILKTKGLIQMTIPVGYITLLTCVGLSMLYGAFRRYHGHISLVQTPPQWLTTLPFKVHFIKSDQHISLLAPVCVGFCAGFIVALLGIGGGFIIIPALLYCAIIPPQFIIGTSLMQMFMVALITTIIQASCYQTVDLLLSVALLTGGILGAHIGSQYHSRLGPISLRIVLGCLALLVCSRLVTHVLETPAQPYTLTILPT
jgi:uncharacterized membrane protein YfcA